MWRTLKDRLYSYRRRVSGEGDDVDLVNGSFPNHYEILITANHCFSHSSVPKVGHLDSH